MNTDPRFVYRDAAANGASPVRLVVLLYEQLIEDLRRAVEAINKHDIEKCAAEQGHALEVLGQLQGRLDLEHGGEVAKNLERFYNLLRSSLLEAQAKQSAQILQQQITHLLSLREAWLEVERATVPPPASAPSSPAGLPEAESPKSSDWTA
jgi:flagellar protein FliS